MTCSQTLSKEMKKNNKTARAIKQVIAIFFIVYLLEIVFLDFILIFFIQCLTYPVFSLYYRNSKDTQPVTIL